MSGQMKRIVIVEDDPKTARLIDAIFAREGYDVIFALDGEEGFSRISEEGPDLVITDILLPKKDGYLLLQQLKRDPRLKSIPVILLSAIYVSELDRRRGLEMGADCFLLKPDAFLSQPFRANGLLEATKILLGEKRPARRTEPQREQALVFQQQRRHTKWIVSQLESDGYEVHVSAHASEISQDLHLREPGLAVLDFDALGSEGLRGLRAECEDLAIIVSLNEESGRQVSEAIKAGADDVMWRPYRSGRMATLFREASQRSQERAAEAKLAEQLKRTTSDLLERISCLEDAKTELSVKNRQLEGDLADVRSREEVERVGDEVSHVARNVYRMLGELTGQVEILRQGLDSSKASLRMLRVMDRQLVGVAQELEKIGSIVGRKVRPYLG